MILLNNFAVDSKSWLILSALFHQVLLVSFYYLPIPVDSRFTLHQPLCSINKCRSLHCLLEASSHVKSRTPYCTSGGEEPFTPILNMYTNGLESRYTGVVLLALDFTTLGVSTSSTAEEQLSLLKFLWSQIQTSCPVRCKIITVFLFSYEYWCW